MFVHTAVAQEAQLHTFIAVCTLDVICYQRQLHSTSRFNAVTVRPRVPGAVECRRCHILKLPVTSACTLDGYSGWPCSCSRIRYTSAGDTRAEFWFCVCFVSVAA